ncbi:unnamed protein product, partial [Polarella glacialis]
GPPPPVLQVAAAEGEASRNCDCCFDSVPTTAGVFCPGKAHFFCAGCLANFLVAFKTAEYADQKQGKGRALCPMKDSDTPFGDAALVAFVPQDVFDDYLHIRIKVAEKGIQEQFEKENAAKIEELKEKLAKATGGSEQMELDKHRLFIMDDIFTLKCPRCKLAFLDYDACSAITCAGCKCGFCSYCLEDCGKDAHKHFFNNNSKCPNEGGPLFIEHKKWLGYQSNRKAQLLCEYLSKVPEALRKKVADLCAPDAKDLGVAMPQDLSDAALAPEAHGIARLSLRVPRRLRAGLAASVAKDGLLKAGVELKLPDPGAKVKVTTDGQGLFVFARKTPTADTGKKHLAARLPDEHEVSVEDDWVECHCPKSIITRGFVKAKHVVGELQSGSDAVLREAGGNGSVLVRKQAKQDEGKNALGYWDDGSAVN